MRVLVLWENPEERESAQSLAEVLSATELFRPMQTPLRVRAASMGDIAPKIPAGWVDLNAI